MDNKKKIETVSQQLLEVCEEKGLSINDMFEISRVFPQIVRNQIEILESNTRFTTDSGSNIQE